MSLRKMFQILSLVLVSLVCFGCSQPQGMTVHVSGPPSAQITLQATSGAFLPTGGSSCCTEEDCVTGAMVMLSEQGNGIVERVVNPTNLRVFSSMPACEGFQVVNQCANATNIQCFEPIFLSNFGGNFTVDGPGVECIPMGGFRELCNNTWVKVSINGKTVASQALVGDTSASVALDLANKINLDPDLSPIVFASVSGSTVTVSVRDLGPDFAYPWSADYSYIQMSFFEPAFQAPLDPPAILGPMQ